MKRTHTCGALNKSFVGAEVLLQGWVDRRRDHGGLIFIDIRDRYGITQLVFDPSQESVFKIGKELRSEYVVEVRGRVELRPDGMVNQALKTGEIEVAVTRCEILNKSKTPPFQISEDEAISEEIRLKYRFLDLRRTELQNNIIMRHRLMAVMRNFLDSQDFLEIETPFLMRSTPEGARDFLVPSRIHRGKFYALPQSPQTYKQILMVSGFDRYFQIVRCFRDEDLRADRQPEFTQLDMEMSFVDEEDIYFIVENLLKEIFEKILDVELAIPFKRMPFDEAMSKYGCDKPDLRFGLEIHELNEHVKHCDFKIITNVIEHDGLVGALNLKGCSHYSRKQIDDLNQFVVDLGGKGVMSAKVTEDSWDSSLTKYFSAESINAINHELDAKHGDLILIIADTKERVRQYLGQLRLKLAYEENLIASDDYNFVWITDFPLLEWDEESERYVAMHHPFTSPKTYDIESLINDPKSVKARAYDLVLNGNEVAGGSIRNHDVDSQMKVFELLKISKHEARDKFGFLLDALQFGAPPHGGIAFGFDRLAMILAKKKSIRDVIAFPKTTAAISLMDGSPADVSERQLEELGLSLSGNKT